MSLKKWPFVLASSASQSLDLLRKIGVTPMSVDPHTLDTKPNRREQPKTYIERINRERIALVAERHGTLPILAISTVIACGQYILPRAETLGDARRCLSILSGRRHQILGGISLRLPGGRLVTRVVFTAVIFKQIDEYEYMQYLETEEWYGMIGGYSCRGQAAAFIRFLSGSYTNALGLPLYETVTLLRGEGLII